MSLAGRRRPFRNVLSVFVAAALNLAAADSFLVVELSRGRVRGRIRRCTASARSFFPRRVGFAVVVSMMSVLLHASLTAAFSSKRSVGEVVSGVEARFDGGQRRYSPGLRLVRDESGRRAGTDLDFALSRV